MLYHFISLFQISVSLLFLKWTTVGMDRLIEVVGEVVRREIAPLRMSLNYVLSELLDPWEKIQTDSSSVNDESAPKKEELERYYNIETNNCMLLGTLPDQHFCANIQRAHIWPKHTHGRGLEILELSPHDLNSPRNYLLLQAEIEYYFDRKKFILLPVNIDHGNFSLRVIVLDPELLKENIRISSHSKKRSFNFPWSALNGLVSDHVFSEEKKPFLRMIAQHAFSSMKNAISSGVVEESFCSSLRSETIELARRSLGEDSIKRVSEPNGLMSLLVNVSSIAEEEEEEAQIESRKSIT